MVTQRGALLEEWAGTMRRRGLAASTIRKRYAVVQRWLTAVEDPWSTTGRDVERWLDGHTGWATAATRYCAVSHLHAFYVWALRNDHTSSDPTVLVERPSLGERLPRPIHPADLAIAVAMAGPKMRACLWLMATSGLRCCEIAGLRWDDVHDGTARVFGKGSKERIVPVHRTALEALDALDRTSVFVFDGWQSTADYQRGGNVSRRVAHHLHGLGISSTAHELRHYCGTEALRSSGNLRKVQKLLGHASPATTAMYTKLDVTELVDMVNDIGIAAA